MDQGHPRRLELERYQVDDLPVPERERIAAHLAGCDACQGYVAELAALASARRASAPPAAFMARLSQRRKKSPRGWLRDRRAGLGVVLAAATAALLGLILYPGATGPGGAGKTAPAPGGAVSFKGAGVVLQRKRGEEVGVLPGDATVRAGDALRVVVQLEETAPVSAWLVDAQGRVDRLHDGASVQLPAGEHALPGSAVIDAPCLSMWLVVVVGGDPGQEHDRALRRAVQGGIPKGEQWWPRGAAVRFLPCE